LGTSTVEELAQNTGDERIFGLGGSIGGTGTGKTTDSQRIGKHPSGEFTPIRNPGENPKRFGCAQSTEGAE